jgi:hypothetical protein
MWPFYPPISLLYVISALIPLFTLVFLLIPSPFPVQLLHFLAVLLSLNPVQRVFNQSNMASERAFDLIKPRLLFFKIVCDFGSQVVCAAANCKEVERDGEKAFGFEEGLHDSGGSVRGLLTFR